MKLGKDIPISKDCVLCICEEGKLWLDGKDVTKFYASIGIDTKEAIERFADDKEGYLKALKLEVVKEEKVITEEKKFVKKEEPEPQATKAEVVYATLKEVKGIMVISMDMEKVLS